MTLTGIYFIYGLCVMFYFMMAWFFMRKNKELLSRLVMVLMLVIGIQSLKDLFFLVPETDNNRYVWMAMTSVDMIAVPLYAFILIELCRPGSLTIGKMIVHEVPFVVLPIAFMATDNVMFYYADVTWAAVYGVSYAIWTVIAIPRYHKLLKHTFSYDENIKPELAAHHTDVVFRYSFAVDCRLSGCGFRHRGRVYAGDARDMDVHLLLHIQA